MVSSLHSPKVEQIRVSFGKLSGLILPLQGAVMSELSFDGFHFLTRTPWADEISDNINIASNEDSWVKQWRGGWQLCAPTAGQPDKNDSNSEFHGRASQAKWKVINLENTCADLEWLDPLEEFRIKRRWELVSEHEVLVKSYVQNLTRENKIFNALEHLILGRDFLNLCKHNGKVRLSAHNSSKVSELNYSGAPIGRECNFGNLDDSWKVLDSSQQARVFAILDLDDKSVSVHSDAWNIHIRWSGLPHMLVWQEFGRSKIPPWDGKIWALGLEPAAVAHGLEPSKGEGILLGKLDHFTWQMSLSFAPNNKEDHD